MLTAGGQGLVSSLEENDLLRHCLNNAAFGRWSEYEQIRYNSHPQSVKSGVKMGLLIGETKD